MLKNTINSLIYLPYFWLFTGLFWLKNGHKILATLVIIASVTVCIHKKLDLSWINIKERLCQPFTLLLLFYTAFAIFSYFTYGYSSRELRALIASCLLLLLIPLDLTRCKAWLAPLLTIASTGTLAFVLINIHILRLGRSSWIINAIPLATFCAALALLAGYGLLTNHTRLQKVLFILSFFLSVIAAIYTQTRGIWLALIVALIILFSGQLRHLKISRQTLILAIITGIITSLLIGPKFAQRYEQTMVEYQKIQRGNYNTSIGLRLQMWQAAIELTAMAPLLGHGIDHINQLKAMHKNEQVSRHLIHFNPAHYHNQFLDKLVKSGLVGLGLFITILLLPIVLSRGQPQHRLVICLSTLFAIASLTDVPLNHSQIVYLYFVIMAVLINQAYVKSSPDPSLSHKEIEHA